MKTTLATIARGVADAALLGNCRLEWAGGEAYGEEAIGELFRASPLALDEGVLIATPASVAWIGPDAALVADLYDGHIGRMWRLGAGDGPMAEQSVAVAFDPDLHQQRGGVYFRAEEHPELHSVGALAVAAAGEKLLAEIVDGSMHRARAFVVRAFTGREASVALFAIHRLTGGAVRTGGFGYALALIDDETTRFIIDPPIARAAAPRL